MRPPILPLACLALALTPAAAHADDAARMGDAIRLEAHAIPFSDSDPDAVRNGRLTYRGGLELVSDDPRFGGLSGLIVSADGTAMLAVTDVGYWVTARLHHDGNTLSDLSDAHIGALRDMAGDPLTASKIEGDAEGLTSLDAFGFPGEVAVSFERHHRVWRYAFARDGMDAMPVAIAMPKALAGATANSGLEALAVLPATDDAPASLVAITEATLDDDGNMIGWRVSASGAADIRFTADEPFKLTDLARLPSGDVLTLERRYSMLGGVGAQMRLIPRAAFDAPGPLDGEIVFRAGTGYSIDNMEGLAARKGEDGETFVYAVSDDNFNGLQRTLLLMFELEAD